MSTNKQHTLSKPREITQPEKTNHLEMIKNSQNIQNPKKNPISKLTKHSKSQKKSLFGRPSVRPRCKCAAPRLSLRENFSPIQFSGPNFSESVFVFFSFLFKKNCKKLKKNETFFEKNEKNFKNLKRIAPLRAVLCEINRVRNAVSRHGAQTPQSGATGCRCSRQAGARGAQAEALRVLRRPPARPRALPSALRLC